LPQGLESVPAIEYMMIRSTRPQAWLGHANNCRHNAALSSTVYLEQEINPQQTDRAFASAVDSAVKSVYVATESKFKQHTNRLDFDCTIDHRCKKKRFF